MVILEVSENFSYDLMRKISSSMAQTVRSTTGHCAVQDNKTFFSRHSGRWSIMMCAVVCAPGKPDLAIIPTMLNSEQYICVEDVLLSFVYYKFDKNFILIQDNAAIHRVHVRSSIIALNRYFRLVCSYSGFKSSI